PSQLMENWAFEKECLDIFAKHYKTKETIPRSLLKKIKESQSFFEGHATVRQLGFATLDMFLHTMNPDDLDDILETEAQVMKEFDLFGHRPPKACMSTTFGHIFNGGYAAGYYSYKWAEVLDADAFELFQEKGIFDTQTAASFREHILSKGGSEHPMTLYKRFRGRGPTLSALLKRSGLET
ncbi:MAG: M3 family metallopeptidase, partial [Bacteriovoracales bacterium]|nr:M3 family metallopeptidase [Bacteriovoracales bacterium]